MSNRIRLKRTEETGKSPTASDLLVGEIAVNLTDRKLFSKSSGGSVVELGGGGSSNASDLTSGTLSDARLSANVLLSAAIGVSVQAYNASTTTLGNSATGTGDIVRATSPTLVTPTLGAATATSVNKLAITAPATSATLTVADGKTLTASNSLTFTGTDNSTLNVGAGGTLGTGAFAAAVTNLWIPASAFIPRTTTGCGVDSRETSTNRQNFDELLFDAATEEYAQALMLLPSNWNNGTVTARFYWTASSGSGDVVWGLAGRAFADDDALDTAFGTGQTATDTLLAANDMHVSAATSAITIGGSPAANRPVQFQLYRAAANAADTLAVDARLLGVEVIFSV